MTNEQRKEETRDIIEKIIVDWLKSDNENATYCAHLITEKLHPEITVRDEQIEYHAGLSLKNANAVREQQSKLQRLEEIINAADEVIQRGYSPGSVDTSGFGENDKYYEALEHYNKLKSKLPSGI